MDVSNNVFQCLFIVYCQLCFSVNGYDIYDVEKLKTDIFNNPNYDTSVRPIVQQSGVLQMQVQLGLSSIVNIDMGNAMLESTGYILARWKDEKLVWDATQYGGLTKLQVDTAEIWNPEIAQLDMVGEFASTTFAFVENTGTVTMIINSELRSFCDLDMRYYPNDTHVCLIVLFSARNPSSEVNIVPLTDNVNLANFKEHGTWTLKSTSVYTDTILIADINDTNVDINRLVNTITVTREPTFSLIHKGIPLLLITFTNLFCHIVPLNSGERISFSVTVFLALVFWEALISDELPKHSNNISILSMIMTIALCQSTLSVITSVVFCRISVEEDRPIPNWLRGLAACRKRSRRKPAHRPRLVKYKQESVELEPNCGSGGDPVNKADVTPNTGNAASDFAITWFDVAEALDEFFGIFQSIIVAIVLATFIVIFVKVID